MGRGKSGPQRAASKESEAACGNRAKSQTVPYFGMIQKVTTYAARQLLSFCL